MITRLLKLLKRQKEQVDKNVEEKDWAEVDKGLHKAKITTKAINRYKGNGERRRVHTKGAQKNA